MNFLVEKAIAHTKTGIFTFGDGFYAVPLAALGA